MADMVPNVGEILKYDPMQVQGFANSAFYIILFLLGAIALFFIVREISKRLSHNIPVTFFNKVGNTEIEMRDWAKRVTLDNKMYYHYLNINKYSPIWSSAYNRIVKYNVFLIIPRAAVGFAAYIEGDKIVPCEVHNNPGIIPVDYDMYNWLVERVKLNHAKYQRNQQLMMLLPIIGLGLVVLAWILGNLFWGNHVERMATMIISSSKDIATMALEKAGAVQIIQ